jgi:glutathione S-transferase
MLRLHDYLFSGNGYKVRLLLHQLGRPFERIDYDIDRGETRTPAFLRINPNGRIPVLELEDGRFLAESDAILVYLAEGTPFLPEDRYARALVLQWMFFEQYKYEPGIAVPRFWETIATDDLTPPVDLEARRASGREALKVMERHLREHKYFVGDRFTIADICLFPYTHVAPEGGFDLELLPAVRAWLERVAAEPGLIPITD